ncbi:hypothetical protein NAPIS_ORF00579 [Vairimorpha apis BRL 01]|uniref:Uncharacterized protein n=1 Tax=Vairimorpha apis BRL 01 TaxID=1037528 RepID=T0L2S2_9MICR|nr:hypothetical protein NAPIS_ORF00579 [Vairimorpha apis BRL 01]
MLFSIIYLINIYSTNENRFNIEQLDNYLNNKKIISLDKYFFLIRKSIYKHYNKRFKLYKFNYNVFPRYYVINQEESTLNPTLLNLSILNTTSKDVLHYCVKKNDIIDHLTLAQSLLNFDYTKISNDLFKKTLDQSLYGNNNDFSCIKSNIDKVLVTNYLKFAAMDLKMMLDINFTNMFNIKDEQYQVVENLKILTNTNVNIEQKISLFFSISKNICSSKIFTSKYISNNNNFRKFVGKIDTFCKENFKLFYNITDMNLEDKVILYKSKAKKIKGFLEKMEGFLYVIKMVYENVYKIIDAFERYNFILILIIANEYKDIEKKIGIYSYLILYFYIFPEYCSKNLSLQQDKLIFLYYTDKNNIYNTNININQFEPLILRSFEINELKSIIIERFKKFSCRYNVFFNNKIILNDYSKDVKDLCNKIIFCLINVRYNIVGLNFF